MVGQIIPWNFPLLMACLEAGRRPGRRLLRGHEARRANPASILVLMELIADLLPPGVVNIVSGCGREAGQALATSKHRKIAFTGSTPLDSAHPARRRPTT